MRGIHQRWAVKKASQVCIPYAHVHLASRLVVSAENTIGNFDIPPEFALVGLSTIESLQLFCR